MEGFMGRCYRYWKKIDHYLIYFYSQVISFISIMENAIPPLIKQSKDQI